MSIFDAMIMGLLQGLTEFLPVSSSGHLVVAQHLLHYAPDEHLLLDAILHLGTLLAVVLIYRKSLWGYVVASVGVLRQSEVGFWERVKGDARIREIFWIGVATVPTGLIGILFRKDFKRLFGSMTAVGIFFAITGLLLLVTHWRSGGEATIEGMGWKRALLIGIAQGLAIAPGISRSGTTIACALLLGVKRDEAARYSFLLSIPAILGAVALELRKANFGNMPILEIGIGGVVAAVSGFLALLLLLKIVKSGRLAWFSPYLWALSAVVLTRAMGWWG